MKKFVIHSEWIEYFRNCIDTFCDEDGKLLVEPEFWQEMFIEAFILFEEIAHYAESGEYVFNDTPPQCRAKAMFLSLKSQIDADLKALKEMEGKGNE